MEKSEQSKDDYEKLRQKDRIVDEIVRNVRKDVEKKYGVLKKYTWIQCCTILQDKDSHYYRITLSIGLDRELVDILVLEHSDGKESEFFGFYQ